MSYQYFIASRYRNKESVLRLANKLKENNKRVYCFIESLSTIKHVGNIGDDPEECMKRLEGIKDWRNSIEYKELFKSHMDALKNSETVIVLFPIGSSASIEAGVAFGLGKKLISIGTPDKPETLYLIFDQCYSSIDEFLSSNH